MTVVANLIAAASVALGYFAWRRRLDVSTGHTIMRGLGAALLLFFAATFTGYAPLEWAGTYLLLTALAVALVAAAVYEVAGFRERRAVRALAGGDGCSGGSAKFPQAAAVTHRDHAALHRRAPVPRAGVHRRHLAVQGSGILVGRAVRRPDPCPGGGGPSRPLPRQMAPLVIGAVVAVTHTMVSTFRRA